jgi:single-stranded-DNA-specific exonuclease
MQIKNPSDFPKIDGLGAYASALMSMNGITADSFFSSLPDTKMHYELEEWMKIMEPMPGQHDFSDMVLKNKSRHFCVIGDYDCDGIMATAIVAKSLRLAGIKCDFITPNRFVDGYGMSVKHVTEALSKGANAIITVDNGITCKDEIAFAKEHDAIAIVTDHHISQGPIPADLVCDPFCDGSKFTEISGATVAFKLCRQLLLDKGFADSQLKDMAAMAAITVMSDSMQMIGENRILVKAALDYLNSEENDPKTFSNRLARMMGYYRFPSDSGILRRYTVSGLQFSLIPVVNAVNRILGDPTKLVSDIVKILDGNEPSEDLGSKYVEINNLRKQCKKDLLKQYHPNGDKIAIVVLPGSDTMNYSGMAGLVASQIAEDEGKPALVGIDDGHTGKIKFSGRSINGFPLYDFLMDLSKDHPELNMEFGGHSEALGGSVPKQKVPAFRTAAIRAMLSVNLPKSEETVVSMSTGSEAMKAYLDFAPYGKGFKFPELYTEGNIVSGGFDRRSRTFTLDSAPSLKIKCYDKELYKYISEIYYNNLCSKVKIDAVISISDGDDGIPSPDLRKICNIDKNVKLAADLREYQYNSRK